MLNVKFLSIQMEKTIKSVLLGIIILCNVQGNAQVNDPVVMKLGKEEITLSEFKSAYTKNNDIKKATEKDINDYIELFVNFRLKCAEAKQMRLDTLPVLQEELVGYRKQAGEKYLTEKDVSDKLLEEALERMKWDIRASHILKKVAPDALPADSLQAYNAIMKIRNRILKGESFAEIAATESDDLSARDKMSAGGEIMKKGNGGDLGYFTVFDLIYAFENGAYNTAVGEVSMPIRSEYGYHIILVHDKKPALGRVKATQILLQYSKVANLNANERTKDSADVEKKINDVYNAVKNGMSLDDAAKNYVGENEKPVQLPMFGSNRFEGDFIKALYGLKIGEVTKPIRTAFGWHVVRVDELMPVVIDDETRSMVRNRILRDIRSNKTKEAFVERVKKENNFKEFLADKKFKTTPVEDFYSVVDTSILSGNWGVYQAEGLNRDMFSFAGKNYNQQDFAKYLSQNQFKGVVDVDIEVLVNYSYRQFIEATVTEYEESILEEKYPEFGTLMREYKDGILLYELSEIKVWRKAENDTVGLENYYQKVKDNHLYPRRAKAEYFKCVDAETTDKLIKMFKKNTPANKIMAKMNKKSVTLILDTVIVFEGQNKELDKFVAFNSWSRNIPVYNIYDNETVRVLEILQPSPKPFEEIRGVVVSEYQNVLEKQWREEIRKNNEVWVDYDKILSLIK